MIHPLTKLNRILFLGVFATFMAGLAKAQNPISYPKDTLISKPELTFEVLWHTFEDNYAFFKLRQIDWRKVYQRYRPTIQPNTSTDSLYRVFSAMLSPFQDDHINVIVPGVKQFTSVKPSPFKREFPTDSLRGEFWKTVDQTLHQNRFGPLHSVGPVYRNKPLFRYASSSQIAYLRFNRCFVDPAAESKEDATVLRMLLDTLFTQLNKSPAMIIDVRENIGGNDEFGFEIAGRFVGKKQVGMYKKTRKRGGGYEELVSPQTWYIEPRGKNAFQGQVILLTNDQTASAGDVFAMIMKNLPQVQLIGDNTLGIYSDMYGFTLPNSWLVSLSNQRYYDAHLVCYEGVGTPVNIRVRNTRQDLITGKDSVLLRALQTLLKKPERRKVE